LWAAAIGWVMRHWWGVPVLPSWARPSRLPTRQRPCNKPIDAILAACQGFARAAHLDRGGGSEPAAIWPWVPSSRGPRVTLLCGGNLRSNTSTQIRLAGPELPQGLFVLKPCWHRRRPAGAGSSRWRFDHAPASCQAASGRRQKGACNSHEASVRWEGSLLVCRPVADSLPRWKSAAGRSRIWLATASTQGVSHHPAACAKLLEQRPID